jgi:hypothetical protein
MVSCEDQQLMLEKKRFGDDGAGTSRSHDLDDRDDQVSHQDEPIAHAANNGRSWRRSQVYNSAADCGRIAIRHGQVALLPLKMILRSLYDQQMWQVFDPTG